MTTGAIKARLRETGKTRQGEKEFLTGLARAFGGALIFALPVLMTMEMWYIGFYIDPLRLALFLIIFGPILVGLAYYSGFEESSGLTKAILEALSAYAVAFITGATILVLIAVIQWGMSLEEIVGKISIQAVPASIGAMLARSQLGGNKDKPEKEESPIGYWGELFLMMVGALFLALNVAPTEEIILISYMMSQWHAAAMIIVSLIIMHAFVYVVEFKGQASAPPGTPFWSVFLRFTIAGYALVFLISAYILWTFGQLQGSSAEQQLMAMVVLSFPAAIGAAAARLIL